MSFVLIRREVRGKDLVESRTDVAKSRLQIGRGAGNDVHLDDLRVSLNHATLERVGDTCVLRDRGSTTGTFVNGTAIREQQLTEGDEIQIGPYTLRASLPAAAPATIVIEQREVGGPSAAEEQVVYVARYRLSAGFFTKWRLTAIGVALLLGGVVAAMVSGQKAPLAPGEVVTAHRLFAHECAQCHTSAWHNVADTACQTCHNRPLHHATQVFTPPCIACHREHQGRHVHLSAVQDTLCIQCHAALHTKEGSALLFTSRVQSFTRDHPEFAVTVRTEDDSILSRIRLSDTAQLRDTARIKLNHAVHLKPEKLGQHGFEQLTCDSCHQLDAQGRYMLPVVYETHCQQCHALEFDARFPQQVVPHDAPEVVQAFLVNVFTQYVLNHVEACEARTNRPLRQRPGQSLTREEARALRECVSEEVQAAERFLFKDKTCKLCHMLSHAPATPLPAIETPAIPHRWLPHSVFKHQVHSRAGRKCEDCHQAARTSQHTSDVLLPGIATCQECHTASKGVSTACVTCHLYHDRAAPH